MEDLINARELHSLQKERMPDDDSDENLSLPRNQKNLQTKNQNKTFSIWIKIFSLRKQN